MKNYYKILNIPRTANDETIKLVYKGLALAWHPDKNLENNKEAEEKFKEIAEAYENLIDPMKRMQHDALLAQQEQPQSRPQASTYTRSGYTPQQSASSTATDDFTLPFMKNLSSEDAARYARTRSESKQSEICKYIQVGYFGESYVLKSNAKCLLDALLKLTPLTCMAPIDVFDADMRDQFIVELLNNYKLHPSLTIENSVLDYIRRKYKLEHFPKEHSAAMIRDAGGIIGQINLMDLNLFNARHLINLYQYNEVYLSILSQFVAKNICISEDRRSNNARTLVIAGLSQKEVGISFSHGKLSGHLHSGYILRGMYRTFENLDTEIVRGIFDNLWKCLTRKDIQDPGITFLHGYYQSNLYAKLRTTEHSYAEFLEVTKPEPSASRKPYY